MALEDLKSVFFSFVVDGYQAIVDREEMVAFFDKNVFSKGVRCSFNEKIIEGEHEAELFTLESINGRALALGMSASDYVNKVMKPIKTVAGENRNLVLYFTEDKESRFNLLGLLSYLEQLNFNKKIYLVTYDEDDSKDEVLIAEIELGEYRELFKKKCIERTDDNTDDIV